MLDSLSLRMHAYVCGLCCAALHQATLSDDCRRTAPLPPWPAPMQEELNASCWELGVPPVVAPQAHYGRPQDAPAHPVIFAGLDFRRERGWWKAGGHSALRAWGGLLAGSGGLWPKHGMLSRHRLARELMIQPSPPFPHPCRVPTSAVEDLPPFQAGAAPDALQQLQDQQAARWDAPWLRPRRQLLAFVPAKPPPSRAATDAWLAARRRRRRGRQLRGTGGSTADFAMNPNTGQLVPVAGPGRPGSAGSEGEGQGGTPSSVPLGEAELLATPSLCSLGSGGGVAGSGSRAGTPTSVAALTLGTTAGTEAAAGRQGTQAGDPHAETAPGGGGGSSDEEAPQDEGEEEQVRPVCACVRRGMAASNPARPPALPAHRVTARAPASPPCRCAQPAPNTTSGLSSSPTRSPPSPSSSSGSGDGSSRQRKHSSGSRQVHRSRRRWGSGWRAPRCNTRRGRPSRSAPHALAHRLQSSLAARAWRRAGARLPARVRQLGTAAAPCLPRPSSSSSSAHPAAPSCSALC